MRSSNGSRPMAGWRWRATTRTRPWIRCRWVKLYTPDAGATWLLTEIDPEAHNAFGLCDLNMGCPELGSVRLEAPSQVRRMMKLPIVQDPHFRAMQRLIGYVREAPRAGRIQA